MTGSGGDRILLISSLVSLTGRGAIEDNGRCCEWVDILEAEENGVIEEGKGEEREEEGAMAAVMEDVEVEVVG
jgi:hypothetical protein